jgi:hypothetical protein
MSWNDDEYVPEVYKRRSNPKTNIVGLSEANPRGIWSTKNGKVLPESVANYIHQFVAPPESTRRRGVNPGRTLAHIRTPQETAKFLKFKNELRKKVNNRERRRLEREELPVLQAQRHEIFNRRARELAEEVRELQALRRLQEMEQERRMLNLEQDDSDSDDERPRVNINAIGGARKKHKKTRKNRRR